MTIPRLVIFDDSCGNFGPLTDLRAVFSLRTGTLNNRVRIESSLGMMATDLHAPRYANRESDALVNQPLRRDNAVTVYTRVKGAKWTKSQVTGDGSVLLVNGRWSGASVGGVDVTALVTSLEVGEALQQRDGQVIAVHLLCDAAQAYVDARFEALPDEVATNRIDQVVLIERPWDILNQLPSVLAYDIEHFHGYGVHETAEVHPSAVLVEDAGKVCVAQGAKVGPLAVLEGPGFIGPQSVVAAHAHIRPNTCVGEICKVGGEIGASIISNYSNKGHAGYLGDTIVGSWVNLGADTTVSNLKNTYGSVRVQLRDGEAAEDSGRTFHGPIIGDYVKTGIGTRLMTGSCIGTGSMIAVSGYAPKFLPGLRFVTDSGDVPYDADRFVPTVRRMMERRDVEMSDALEALIRAVAIGARDR